MSSPKLITVWGATGTQGSSVIHSLIKNPSFRVRAITRNPSSIKAKALASLGIEMVQADGLVPAQLSAALMDSWALFLNTTGEDPAVDETTLGKNVIDAAKEVGVQVVVYSAGAAPAEMSQGEMRLGMMDDKAIISHYAEAAAFETLTFVDAGWYLENFLHPTHSPLIPTDTVPNSYILPLPRWGTQPNTPVPFVSIADDYGDIVHGAFISALSPSNPYHNTHIQAISQLLGFSDLADAITSAGGVKCEYVEIKLDEWETGGNEMLEQVKGLFAFVSWAEGMYFGVESDISPARELKGLAQGLTGDKVWDENGGRKGLIGVREWLVREFGTKK